MLSVKQGGIKYHFSSLWYDPTYDWTQVSRTIGEHSTHFSWAYKNVSAIFCWLFKIFRVLPNYSDFMKGFIEGVNPVIINIKINDHTLPRSQITLFRGLFRNNNIITIPSDKVEYVIMDSTRYNNELTELFVEKFIQAN